MGERIVCDYHFYKHIKPYRQQSTVGPPHSEVTPGGLYMHMMYVCICDDKDSFYKYDDLIHEYFLEV